MLLHQDAIVDHRPSDLESTVEIILLYNIELKSEPSNLKSMTKIHYNIKLCQLPITENPVLSFVL